MGGICDKDATNFCQAEHRAGPWGASSIFPLPLSAKARSNQPSSQQSKVDVDEQAQEGAKLRGGEHGRGIVEDAVERRGAGFAQLLPSLLLGLEFLLLTFVLGFAFLITTLLFGVMLRAALPIICLALFGLFLRLLLGCWLHDRGRVIGLLLGKTGGGGGVMQRAMTIGANGDGLSGMASKDDQCGFGVGAWRLGVRVVGRIEFTVGVLGEGCRGVGL